MKNHGTLSRGATVKETNIEYGDKTAFSSQCLLFVPAAGNQSALDLRVPRHLCPEAEWGAGKKIQSECPGGQRVPQSLPLSGGSLRPSVKLDFLLSVLHFLPSSFTRIDPQHTPDPISLSTCFQRNQPVTLVGSYLHRR